MKKFLIVVTTAALAAAALLAAWFYVNNFSVEADKNLPAAMAPILQLAKAGDSDAQYKMGKAYFYGETGVTKDYKKGFYWIEKAVAQNHSDAQHELAIAYKNAKGVTKNLKRYETYMTLSANNGNVKAMLDLAHFYKELKNIATANEWYEKAAEEGELEAVNYLVSLFCGADIDKDKCWIWLPKSAQAGILDSIVKLAKFYLTGEIGRQSNKGAEYWFTIAADKGDIYSMLVLVQSFASKNGFTKQDKSKAFKYALAAAQTGNEQAMLMLSRSYRKGIFTDVDLNKAAQWEAKFKGTNFIAEPVKSTTLEESARLPEKEKQKPASADSAAGINVSLLRNNLVRVKVD
ncbi:hypothetical protein AAIR98_000791 [Elusimicrobium simillimum]|uniref:tetratricopeptide repeat protein n=1 Tax=Elusimicrobium simillimum TaxID=3143438 RepID=UPI003C6FF9B8